jgi:hypothetical protein
VPVATQKLNLSNLDCNRDVQLVVQLNLLIYSLWQA